MLAAAIALATFLTGQRGRDETVTMPDRGGKRHRGCPGEGSKRMVQLLSVGSSTGDRGTRTSSSTVRPSEAAGKAIHERLGFEVDEIEEPVPFDQIEVPKP